MGLLLAGYAAKTVTKGFGTHLELRNGQDQFRPWGHCTPETLVLHYQSHDRLLRRRFERARRGEPLCGEGFAPHDVCVRAEFHKPATFTCQNGGVFDAVPFATFSRTNKFIGPRYPWCKEGPSAHEADHDCRLKDSHIAALLLRRCIGKSTCTVQATEATFGSTILECARDARGWERPQLLATLRCTSNVTR